VRDAAAVQSTFERAEIYAVIAQGAVATGPRAAMGAVLVFEQGSGRLAHVRDKWEPVFGKDHGQANNAR